MKKAFLFLPFAFLLSCQPRYDATISMVELEDHMNYLASDDLKGRLPGSPEDKILGSYITEQYQGCGLSLYEKSGLQYFNIATEMEMGDQTIFRSGEDELEVLTEYTPLSFSSSGSVSGELVFAGYGFHVNEEELQWDDYANIDIRDKWLMILRGVPGKQEASSPWFNYSADRDKALMASDMGAAGVILVSAYSFSPGDGLEELKGKQHPVSIPVVQMTKAAAEELLASNGIDSLAVLERMMIAENGPASLATGLELEIAVDLQAKELETFNTLAMLEGSSKELKDEYVLIGAHHDHLGMGGKGTSSRTPDTLAIHYGADDNASGVSGVMEIAELMADLQPERSMVFATFGAEEMGIIGSKYMVENLPFPVESIQAMINLDMVGRMTEDRQLQIGGVGTSPVFQALLDSINVKYGFNIKYASEGYGPSDHASFYAKDVPVLFISTGAHSDYHTPMDRADAINYEGLQEVLNFTADVATLLAGPMENIEFTEAGPKVKGSSKGRHGSGVTLGLMPDVTYDGNDGMPVMFTTEGKPAAVGGIQKGDIILSMDGKSVGNVYDYMSRLGQFKEGMSIIVEVKRGDDLMEILVII